MEDRLQVLITTVKCPKPRLSDWLLARPFQAVDYYRLLSLFP